MAARNYDKSSLLTWVVEMHGMPFLSVSKFVTFEAEVLSIEVLLMKQLLRSYRNFFFTIFRCFKKRDSADLEISLFKEGFGVLIHILLGILYRVIDNVVECNSLKMPLGSWIMIFESATPIDPCSYELGLELSLPVYLPPCH